MEDKKYERAFNVAKNYIDGLAQRSKEAHEALKKLAFELEEGQPVSVELDMGRVWKSQQEAQRAKRRMARARARLLDLGFDDEAVLTLLDVPQLNRDVAESYDDLEKLKPGDTSKVTIVPMVAEAIGKAPEDTADNVRPVE